MPSFSINLGLKKTSVYPSVKKKTQAQQNADFEAWAVQSGWIGAFGSLKLQQKCPILKCAGREVVEVFGLLFLFFLADVEAFGLGRDGSRDIIPLSLPSMPFLL